MLRMETVSKSYRRRGQTVAALKDTSLTLSAGEFVAVVGPSGSGKSTLLLMLGGMLSPSSGRVLLEQQSLYDLTSDQRARLRRQKVGFVFQTFNLVPYLTALENVQVPLYLAGLDSHIQRQRATALLERVGLGDRLHHKPCELSVGQQQRVALARTLANDPALILADEPTGNLDPETGEQIVGFFEELHREGRTIVMVTHDVRAAARARRVLRLSQGTILADGAGVGPTAAPFPGGGPARPARGQRCVTASGAAARTRHHEEILLRDRAGRERCWISWPSPRPWPTRIEFDSSSPCRSGSSASASSSSWWGWRPQPCPNTCRSSSRRDWLRPTSKAAGSTTASLDAAPRRSSARPSRGSSDR